MATTDLAGNSTNPIESTPQEEQASIAFDHYSNGNYREAQK